MEPELRSFRYYSVLSGEPWGDYGRILVHGVTTALPRKDGQLQLERTGPTVPPISLPQWNEMLVVDHVKQQLESLNLPDVQFREVIKARIVDLDWSNWDRELDLPPLPPYQLDGEIGGASDYVLSRPHSIEISNTIGPIWELVLPCNGEWVTVDKQSPPHESIAIIKKSVTHKQIFIGHQQHTRDSNQIFVDEELRSWLAARSAGWLRFLPVGMI